MVKTVLHRITVLDDFNFYIFEDADITVVNGDLMDGRVEDLGDAVKLLGQLSSKQGVFFTTGNHEYISGTSG